MSIVCDECPQEVDRTLCDDCLEAYSEKNATAVRNWLAKERAKPATDVTPEIAAIFERCAEDLE